MLVLVRPTPCASAAGRAAAAARPGGVYIRAAAAAPTPASSKRGVDRDGAAEVNRRGTRYLTRTSSTWAREVLPSGVMYVQSSMVTIQGVTRFESSDGTA